MTPAIVDQMTNDSDQPNPRDKSYMYSRHFNIVFTRCLCQKPLLARTSLVNRVWHKQLVIVNPYAVLSMP